MLELDMNGLRRLVEEHNYAPLFVTVSGAHLYGFPSPNSDVDLRGCHTLPLADVVGLDTPQETIEPEFDLADGVPPKVGSCVLTILSTKRLSDTIDEEAAAVQCCKTHRFDAD